MRSIIFSGLGILFFLPVGESYAKSSDCLQGLIKLVGIYSNESVPDTPLCKTTIHELTKQRVILRGQLQTFIDGKCALTGKSQSLVWEAGNVLNSCKLVSNSDVQLQCYRDVLYYKTHFNGGGFRCEVNYHGAIFHSAAPAYADASLQEIGGVCHYNLKKYAAHSYCMSWPAGHLVSQCVWKRCD